MEYRQLGRSGIKVSTLTLGTMMFGGPIDEATAARIIGQAEEQGVNSIASSVGTPLRIVRRGTYPVAYEDGVREVRFLDFFYRAGPPVPPGYEAGPGR